MCDIFFNFLRYLQLFFRDQLCCFVLGLGRPRRAARTDAAMRSWPKKNWLDENVVIPTDLVLFLKACKVLGLKAEMFVSVSLMIFGCHFNMFNNGLFLGIQFRLSRAVECESENRSKTFFCRNFDGLRVTFGHFFS